MSSVYEHYLPNAFPYRLEAHKDTVNSLVEKLVSWTRPDTPDGSSFAVTVEHAPDRTYLWMSKVSYEYLEKFIAPMLITVVNTRERE